MFHSNITDLITAIQSLYARLQTSEASSLWQELETLCAQVGDDIAMDVLNDPHIQALRPHLQALRATYEYELEKAEAQHILQQPDPTSAFASHGMYQRYVTVVALEMALIRQFQTASPLTALFIGSGPLPSTALLLAQHWDCRVDCLDRNHEACALGAAIAQALSLDAQVAFRCADIFDVTDLTHYDAIFLAALVGIGPTAKTRIIAHIHQCLRPGQVLILRAGRGIKTLLYTDIAEISLPGCKIRTASAPGVTQTEIVACMHAA